MNQGASVADIFALGVGRGRICLKLEASFVCVSEGVGSGV